MSIPFTQYLLPNGRRMPTSIERPPDIEEKAQAIIERGLVFEIEMLMTGQISMTCENQADEVVLAHEICRNGPEVPEHVDKLVCEAFREISKAPITPSTQNHHDNP